MAPNPLRLSCRFLALVLLLGSNVESSNVDTEALKGGVFKCKDKCGQWDNMPCSCEARCAVYHNCCENMASDCPQIWAESRARYADLSQREVRCEHPGYFMIASCPHTTSSKGASSEDVSDGAETGTLSSSSSSSSSSSVEDALQDIRRPTEETEESTTEPICAACDFEKQNATMPVASENSHSHNDQVLQEEKSEDTDDGNSNVFIDFYNAAPVTDPSTGITYMNSEIFSCNEGNLSHYEVWDSLFMYYLDSPTSTQEFEEIALFKHYISPASLDKWHIGPPCMPGAIGTCMNTTTEKCPTLSAQCKSFISYVRTNSSRIYYNNRYCYKCNNEDQDDYGQYIPPATVWTRDVLPLLRITTTLSTKNRVESISATVASDPFNMMVWSETVCSLDSSAQQSDTSPQRLDDDEEGEQQQIQQELQLLQQQQSQQQQTQPDCAVKSCMPGFYNRPDGRCKIFFTASVAFLDDEFFFTSAEAAYLPQFVQCTFQHFLGFEVADTTQRLTAEYDFDAKKLFYVVDVLTYLTSAELFLFRLIDSEEATVQLIKFLAVAKALKKHFKHEREARPGEVRCPRVSGTRSFQCRGFESAQSNVVISIDIDDDLPFIRENLNALRIKVVDNTTTTICLRKFSWVKKEVEKELNCIDDQLFKEDLQLLEEFSGLPCLAVFPGSQSFAMVWWEGVIVALITSTLIKFQDI